MRLTALAIALTAGVLSVSAQLSLRGKVVDSAGEAVPGAMIKIYDGKQTKAMAAYGSADTGGRFAIRVKNHPEHSPCWSRLWATGPTL